MEEKILVEGLCNRIKGAFVQNGHGMLTNQRFIYSKHSFGKIAAMGVLVNLTKGSYDFDIPVNEISRIEESKHMFNKIIVIHTMKGEEFKFYFTKIEEWKIHFNNVLNGNANREKEAVGSTADEILKYKNLLDMGVITQEEFETKKKQLLGKLPTYKM